MNYVFIGKETSMQARRENKVAKVLFLFFFFFALESNSPIWSFFQNF
jgi:hypothetical protein